MGEDDASDVLADGAWHRLDTVFLNLLPATLRAELVTARAEYLANPIDARDAAHLQRLKADPDNAHIPRIRTENLERLHRGKSAQAYFAEVLSRAAIAIRDLMGTTGIETQRLVDGLSASWCSEPPEIWSQRSIWLPTSSVASDDWLSQWRVSRAGTIKRRDTALCAFGSLHIRRATVPAFPPHETSSVDPLNGPNRSIGTRRGRPEKAETVEAKKFAREFFEDEWPMLDDGTAKQAECERYVHEKLAERGWSLAVSTVRKLVTEVSRTMLREQAEKAGKE